MDEFKFTGFFIHIRHDTHMPDGLLGTRTGEKHQIPLLQVAAVVYLDSFSKLGTRRTRQSDIQRLKDISSETGTIKSALRIHLPVTVRHSDKLFGFLYDILAGD